MATIYLALGSNLGDRHANIAKALELLSQANIEIIKHSTIIETDPVGGPEQGKFLNSVLQAETELSPVELLTTIQDIETQLGRVRTVENGPRTIDIDILLYNDFVIKTLYLVIPHPRMFERNFVLNPLKEIAPNIIEQLSDACY